MGQPTTVPDPPATGTAFARRSLRHWAGRSTGFGARTGSGTPTARLPESRRLSPPRRPRATKPTRGTTLYQENLLRLRLQGGLHHVRQSRPSRLTITSWSTSEFEAAATTSTKPPLTR